MARRDTDSVHRVVRAVATHAESWEKAAASGITEMAKSITDLDVARVVERDVVVRDGAVALYRVKLEVSYRIDRRRVVAGTTQVVRRVLVLANQTLDSPALASHLAARAAQGPAEFHVVAPTGASRLATLAKMADPIMGYAALDDRTMAEAEDEARADAQGRVDAALASLRAAGAGATGEVYPGDPLVAVAAVLERATFDEVIVSTLPAGLSRWSRMDLPKRIERRFGLPVTLVEQPR